MAIFGRITARQRLRRATRESLAIPAFSSPIDCSPWVTGGLWPAELSTITPETATLAEYLKADLQRIANSANDELRIIKRAGMADLARQAQRPESSTGPRTGRAPSRINDSSSARGEGSGGRWIFAITVAVRFGRDLDATQVIPAVTEMETAVDAPTESTPPVVEPPVGKDEPEAARPLVRRSAPSWPPPRRH